MHIKSVLGILKVTHVVHSQLVRSNAKNHNGYFKNRSHPKPDIGNGTVAFNLIVANGKIPQTLVINNGGCYQFFKTHVLGQEC
jgi:hypothetical protein